MVPKSSWEVRETGLAKLHAVAQALLPQDVCTCCFLCLEPPSCKYVPDLLSLGELS